VAIVVNKQYGSAARRNLLRRRFREAFRQIISRNDSIEIRRLKVSISVVAVYRLSKSPSGKCVSFERIKTDIWNFVEAFQVSSMS
jgi:Ribonuclease P